MASDQEKAESAKDINLAYRDGIAATASFLSSDPDHETFIFRRFDNVAARNLLQLQSELIELERRQFVLDKYAAISHHAELPLSNRDWTRMKANAPKREEERKRVQLADEIEQKLKKYC